MTIESLAYGVSFQAYEQEVQRTDVRDTIRETIEKLHKGAVLDNEESDRLHSYAIQAEKREAADSFVLMGAALVSLGLAAMSRRSRGRSVFLGAAGMFFAQSIRCTLNEKNYWELGDRAQRASSFTQQDLPDSFQDPLQAVRVSFENTSATERYIELR